MRGAGRLAVGYSCTCSYITTIGRILTALLRCVFSGNRAVLWTVLRRGISAAGYIIAASGIYLCFSPITPMAAPPTGAGLSVSPILHLSYTALGHLQSPRPSTGRSCSILQAASCPGVFPVTGSHSVPPSPPAKPFRRQKKKKAASTPSRPSRPRLPLLHQRSPTSGTNRNVAQGNAAERHLRVHRLGLQHGPRAAGLAGAEAEALAQERRGLPEPHRAGPGLRVRGGEPVHQGV